MAGKVCRWLGASRLISWLHQTTLLQRWVSSNSNSRSYIYHRSNSSTWSPISMHRKIKHWMVQSRQRTTRLSTLFISINLTGSTQLQSTVRSNRHLLHNIKEIRLMSTKIHRSINQNSNFRKDKRRMIVWSALTVVTLPSLLRYPSSQIRHGRAML